MKRTLLILTFLFFFQDQYAQSPLNDACWTLVWKDDFKQPGLSTADLLTMGWGVADNFDHGGEPQVFMAANVTVNTTDGLVLEVKPESPALTCGSCTETTHYYSSGSLGSNNWSGLTPDHMPQFGYIEAKMIVPKRYGLFPAFWIWDDSPVTHDESMTFEFVPGSTVTCSQSPFYMQPVDENLLSTTLHWDSFVPGVCENETQGQMLPVADHSVSHTYGFEWSPSKVIWYIDDVSVRVAPNPGPIQDPSSIIINLSLYDWIEASNHGDDIAYKYDFSTNTPNYFPSAPYYEQMKIEYVSYYRLDNSLCGNNLIMTSGNIGSYDDKVRYDITTSGTISIPGGYSHQSWRASNGITISGDFSVPSGSELYLDVNPCY